MTTALTVRGRRRDPAHASGRCRKAAEHYVKNGCKHIAPSLIHAGYSAQTAKDPRKNGFTHEWLCEVAAYWNKGAQATARSYLSQAIRVMADIMHDTQAGAQARGSAAKVLIDVGKKEEETQSSSELTIEEQAKWMAQIRHWKRVFLRRGILIGLAVEGGTPHQRERATRLLAELDWSLGKGPCPAWLEEADEDEGLLGSEGDSRSAGYLEAEIVEESDADRQGAGDAAGASGSGADPADSQ